MKIKLFFLFILIAISLSPANGLCWEDQWLYYADFNWNNDEWKTRENRIFLASALLKKMDLLFSFMQNPKPSEIDWFKKEISELAKLEGEAWVNRFNLFESAPEYHKIMLHKHLSEIKQLLSALLYKDISVKHEMSAWSNLSLKLMDKDLFHRAVKSLSEVGYFPSSFHEKNHDWYYDASRFQNSFSCRYPLWGKDIQKVIINNYLKVLAMTQ